MSLQFSSDNQNGVLGSTVGYLWHRRTNQHIITASGHCISVKHCEVSTINQLLLDSVMLPTLRYKKKTSENSKNLLRLYRALGCSFHVHNVGLSVEDSGPKTQTCSTSQIRKTVTVKKTLEGHRRCFLGIFYIRLQVTKSIPFETNAHQYLSVRKHVNVDRLVKINRFCQPSFRQSQTFYPATRLLPLSPIG